MRWPSIPRPPERAGSRSSFSELVADPPGIAGVEELRQVALPQLAPGDLDLLRHQLVVDGALDRSKDPDRGRADGRVGKAAQREREGWILGALVVAEQCVLADRIDVHDLHAASGPRHHSL